MSELKAYDHEFRPNEYGKFYLKSEADKVIAEKDKEIAELKEIDSKNRSAYYKDLAMMARDVAHHKYKRCLYKAKQCEEKCRGLENAVIGCSTYPYMSTCPTDCDPRYTFLKRWRKRWLELAEKFKEAK